MWKVHLPATSYLLKQTPFFGTNHFLKALNKPLLKSAGLTFDGELAHGWAPTPAGLSDDHEEHDHPPFNHHPETGELLEGGLHPIDWMHREMMRDFGLDPRSAQAVMQEAIDLYNRRHDVAHGEGQSNHTLPNFDSPQWRKVHVGPYYGNEEDTHKRLVRGADPVHEGGPRPLITYSLNRGNVPGGAQGSWVDAGYTHFNRELGEVLRNYGVDPKMVNNLRYVQYNRLIPGDLSGGIVQSISTGDFEKYQQSGQLPDHYLTDAQRQSMSDQRMHGEVHAHQLTELMPNDAFRMMGAGGRGAGAGFNGQKLQAMFDQLGLDHEHSPEELNQIARSAMIRLLFQNKSHGINSDSGGGVGGVLRPIIRGIGSHHDEETYRLHAQHAASAKVDEKTPFARSANHRAKEIVSHMSHAASKLMAEGASQDEALERVLTQLRASDAESNVSDEYRDKVQGVVNQLLGASGHERFSFGDIPTSYEDHSLETPVPDFGRHDAPDHWQHRVYSGQHMLAPYGSTVREEPMMGGGMGGSMGGGMAPEPTPRAAPAPMAGGTVGVAPRPMATRMASPAEQAFQQQQSLDPRQRFFDTVTGEMVQQNPDILTSRDVVSDIDLIRKKMGYFDGFLRGEF